MSNHSSPSVNSYEPHTPEGVMPESQGSCFHNFYPRNSNFNQSPILIEKGLNTQKIDQWGLNRIDGGGWRQFIRHPRGRINISVVREFYSALSEVRSVDSTYFVTVRGYVIPFTSFIINQVFEIPPVSFTPNPHYEFQWELEIANNVVNRTSEAFQVLFPSFDNNHDISTPALLPHLRAWKHFINSRVYPTDDFSGVDDDEMLLLYALTVGAYVDWGVLIHKQAILFAVARRSRGKPMPFAWLISRICVHLAGVHELDTDEIFPSRGPHVGLLPVDTPGCSSTD